MLEENAKGLTKKLKDVDALALELQKTFAQISLQHQKDGGYIEYLYLSHFLEESLDISHLFQHLFEDQNTKRFLAISNRMLLEVVLKAEYIIQLKSRGNDKVILSLASKDMASMMSALNEAVDSKKEAPANKTLTKLNIANKILETDFDLEKVRPNTPTFPTIRDLCNQSELCIKDYCGDRLWHYYALWSWSNHSRIGDKFAINQNDAVVLNNYAECFIEMYLKVIKLLSIHSKDSRVEKLATNLMQEIRVLNV